MEDTNTPEAEVAAPAGESRLNIAVHTAPEDLNDEQKALITSSWGALSETEKETYAELAPVEVTDTPAEETPETPAA